MSRCSLWNRQKLLKRCSLRIFLSICRRLSSTVAIDSIITSQVMRTAFPLEPLKMYRNIQVATIIRSLSMARLASVKRILCTLLAMLLSKDIQILR